MSDLIVSQDLAALIDGWLEAEKNGIEFPVPFDTAWQMAGYSTKSNAKKKLKNLIKGKEFSSKLIKNPTGGRSSESINLNCDSLKHFCLMAETEQGQAIRQYFIEAEKKWRLVESNFPQVASEVEMIQLKIELAKLETKKADIENKTLNLRNTIVKTCSEPVQQKILGYSVIEKIEYRDRVILNNQVINEGNTLNKTELCHRYGILTKNGKPDYRRLNTLLDHKGITERSEAWEMSAVIQENYQFKREYLPVLDSLMVNGDRQLFICE
jgi:phage anti-repressor protein